MRCSFHANRFPKTVIDTYMNNSKVDPHDQARTQPARGTFWRRAAFAAACVATLVAGLYVVENWRGQRHWDRVQVELEAKGARLDWDHYIPPAIPDDQNIFKAPQMEEWFVKGRGNTNSLRHRLSTEGGGVWNVGKLPKAEEVLLATVTPRLPGQADGSRTAGIVIKANSPGARLELERLVLKTSGHRLHGLQGFDFSTEPVAGTKPLEIVLEGDPLPNADQILALMPGGGTNLTCRLVPGEGSAFKLVSNPQSSARDAADYLAWSREFDPDFQKIREALTRPHARIEGSYDVPFAGPLPDFVTMRCAAQVLGQRAQCHLLLGEPAEAAQDLLLVRRLCRFLGNGPGEAPTTLVSAMIEVAICGVYVGVIKDGFTLGVWQREQLVELQQETAKIRLLPLIVAAFQAERAGAGQLLTHTKSADLWKAFSGGTPAAGWGKQVQDPMWWFLTLAPRGWLYQNRVVISRLHQSVIEGYDPAGFLVLPESIDASWRKTGATLDSRTPYNWLAAVAVPNFSRANQTVARNQTLAGEAIVACALEQYRLQHGGLPETLEALVPQFIQNLPHDIIGGKPLHYRRMEEGRYLLYSVGWNGQDDAGTAADQPSDGDWVW